MAYNNRGWARNKTGSYNQAIQDLNKAIQLDPGLALAYYNRGRAYADLGQDAEADADKAKACSLDSIWC